MFSIPKQPVSMCPLWIDTELFYDINYFTYGYTAVTFLALVAKILSVKYKNNNPGLDKKDYAAIVKIIDAAVEGLTETSQIIGMAALIEIAYKVKNALISEPSFTPYPTIIDFGVIYGAYKGLQAYAHFKPSKQIEILMEVSDSDETNEEPSQFAFKK